MNNKKSIRVAIVGVGNCASALIQGVSFYRIHPDAPGLIIRNIQGFTLSDIEFVAAFDVDQSKINCELGKAIFLGRNNVPCIGVDTSYATCRVSPAPLLDGMGDLYKQVISVSTDCCLDIDSILANTRPDVLINYLPVGSDEATKFWATKCLDHGISFLNAIPSFIVSDKIWASRFRTAGLPCAGDDVKSQIGATIIHRALVHLFNSRGGELKTSYQLNFGGNMDFFNMLDDGRLSSKKISKLSSVRSEVGNRSNPQLHISPTDFVGYLGDQKIAYINLLGTGFAGSEIEIECKLKVWDSNNSAGVVVDVIRFLAAARIASVAGPIAVAPFYFKSPPHNLTDDEAEKIVQAYATGQMIEI